MIIVATIKGIVISALSRGFDTKEKEVNGVKIPPRHLELDEITFFAPEVNITGCLKDWAKSMDVSKLKAGDHILVHFNKCGPTKGMNGVFDFTGFATLEK